jgi:hypothetical protein
MIFDYEDATRAEATRWPEIAHVGPDRGTIDQASPAQLRLRRDALKSKDPNLVWMAGRKA